MSTSRDQHSIEYTHCSDLNKLSKLKLNANRTMRKAQDD
jgi:hypothetical protein